MKIHRERRTARRQCFFCASSRVQLPTLYSRRYPKRGGGYGCSPPARAGNLSCHGPCEAKAPELYPIPPAESKRDFKFAGWRKHWPEQFPIMRRQMAAFPVSGGIAARGALFLNGGTLEIASVSTEVNSIVPYLCAVYSRVNVPGKIPVLIHKYAIEIFRGRHFLED